ncbi:MAG TPA: chemotaxis response regulator protein-glutamate methylesterase [Vicinamibacteria bacterium]
MSEPTRVLVVDDSAVVRQTLLAVLSPEEGFAVETAADPFIAMRRMERTPPHVIVLDLELPRMDGLTFLRRLVAAPHPVPVVVCSSLSGGTSAMRALEQGAVAVVEKPRLDMRGFLLESAVRLVDTVRGAAQARVGRPRVVVPAPPSTVTVEVRRRPGTVIAVGASIGGPEALRELLAPLPSDAPPVLVVQHLPEAFTRALAARLDQCCRVRVREAAHGDAVLPGQVLVAPGDRHLLLRRHHGGGYVVHLSSGPLVSRHRPSVDVLFRSVAQAAGASAVGIILTGMGDDGAEGLLEMRRAGALTLAQDERSCVVYGMPREAVARGAASASLPLRRLSEALAGPPAALSADRSRTSA